jgi:4-amino-4-deoxy-L-arabinose transferase-like glycosyltransferase
VQPASGDRRDAAIVIAVVLSLTLPVTAKAVHIDDVYFLEVAQNVRRDPLRPLAGAVALEDVDYRVFAAQGRCPNTFASMSHPPLVPYVLALAAWVARGYSERWLHLAFAPFAVAAGLAMLALARRFTRHPLAATLLLITSPVFVLSGHGLMTDMPALALSSLALAVFIFGVDRDDRRKVVLAGLLAGLAVLARYSSALTLLLLIAYAAGRGKTRRAASALAAASVVLAAWAAQNLLVDGTLHVFASTGHYRSFYAGRSFDRFGLVKKALSDLSSLGGTAFVASALLLLAGTWRRAATFAVAALAAVSVFVLKPPSIERLGTYSATDVTLVACFFAFGVVLVTDAVWPASNGAPGRPEMGKDSDRTFLVIWLVCTLGGALLLLPFGSARYLLPALPPLWLLLVRRAQAMLGDGRDLRLALGLTIAQGAALSALLGLADAEWAASYRALAQDVRAAHPGRSIWYVGEWGFRYYMDAAGGRYLRSTDEHPDVGDIVVRPSIAGMHAMSPGVQERAVLLQQIPLPGQWPFRLMSFDAKAGYYSHHWGYLPWRFSHYPLDTVEIFEIRAPGPRVQAETCASS